jgi:hypothetical protein
MIIQLGAPPEKPQWEIDRDERRRVEQQRVADEEKAAEELRRIHRAVSHIPVQLLIAILNDASQRHDCRTVMWAQRWGQDEPRTSAGRDSDFMAYQLWRAAWPFVVYPSTEEENELKQDVPALFGRKRTIAQLEARMPEREMEAESYEEVNRRGVDNYYSRSTRANYQTEREWQQAVFNEAQERSQLHMRRVMASMREEFGDAIARARGRFNELAMEVDREVEYATYWN